MIDFRADLHIHSFFSDGDRSPEEILYRAKENNISGISITDHDTVEAYTEALFQLAKKLNIHLISGVEISSELFSVNVHILGYNFDVGSKEFKKFLKMVREKRKQRNEEILKKLKDKNIMITNQELIDFAKSRNIAETVIGRVHIAKLMYEKGYVASVQEAFDKYIKDEAPCYAAGSKFSPEEIIEQIHLARGKAVLAHPNLIKSDKVIQALLNMSFDGLEAYYAKLLNVYEQKWIEIAKKKDWLITGGSDFHGEIRPYIDIGDSWIDIENFNKLIE